jgi:hypothetical protein
MIKTTTQVSYDPINPDTKAIVFAQVVSAVRNDINETYTLTIKEWVEIPYQENVPVYDEQGNEIGMEIQNFIRRKDVRTMQRVMTFTDADNLTAFLDSEFTITETNTARRKKYTILGHLVINNQESVRKVEWELV